MKMEEDKHFLPGSEGEHKMQERLGTQDKAKEFYSRQMLDFLAKQMQDFIQKQEMVFISTSDKEGECDCSFRSGKAGFMHVLNAKTLAYAELKGNGVMASMGNISENPHIGMLFLDFLEDKVGLHVNGKAKIIQGSLLDAKPDDISVESLKEIESSYHQKQVSWILVEVEEAYIHCSKNIPMFKKNEDISELSKARPIDYFNLDR